MVKNLAVVDSTVTAINTAAAYPDVTNIYINFWELQWNSSGKMG